MRRRFLGNSGLEVSVLAMGAMDMGNSGRPGVGGVDLEGAKRQVDRAFDAGVTLFDTADAYSRGESEELLGKALGDKRKRIVLATKVFGPMGPDAMDLGVSRRHIIDACEGSLRRLGTDWIDLYQAHQWDGVVPIEETLRAFEDLIRSGKVRYIGSSNYSAWHQMKALAAADRLGVNRQVSQQIQYSLIVRDAEHELIPCGVDQGVGALIWSPLGQGYLSGKYRSGQEARLTLSGQLHRMDTPRARATLDVLDAIVAERGGGITCAQVAIAWLLRKPGVTSVIFGAKTLAQLDENIAATAIRLDDAEMQRLDEVSAPDLPYPITHQRMALTDRRPALPAAVAYEPA